MVLKTLDDFQFKDKLVLLRIDVNVPVVKNKVLDSQRFFESARTIKELLKKGAKLVIIAHQGRKGDSDFLPSLEQHARILSRYVGTRTGYVDDLFDTKALNGIDALENGEAILLKNVRCFDDEGDLNKSRFNSFSKLFDIYVNDAFSVCHRNHGSIVIPPKLIPSCIGRSLEKEIEALGHFRMKSGNRSVFLIGGAKIEDYLPLLDVLKNKNNKIIASGVFANLILKIKGIDLGYENEWMKKRGYYSLIPKLCRVYAKYKDRIILPVDFAVGSRNVNLARREEKDLNEAPFNNKIWDLGHESVKLFKQELNGAKFIFMKGPLGYSEIAVFRYATLEILKEISRMTRKGNAFSLISGGHLSTTIKKYRIPNNFSHISLEGGALIYYISGKKLPGLEALKR